MSEKKILIVDDKKNIREVLSDFLQSEGYQTVCAESGEEGITTYGIEKPDLILTDLIMKKITGVEFIKEIRKSDSTVAIIILTAFGSISSAVEAIKAGADDYMTKPLNYELLKIKISKIFDERKKDIELSVLKQNLTEKWGTDNIIGKSSIMQKMFSLIKAVAPTDSAVIIQGECGTGKELIAKSIHANSGRSGSAFVIVDCSAIPENLIESELFGYEKGAFTGADRRKIGRIEEARGGTLFLDEIGELPLLCQAKFLRVIQEHQFVRIGGSEQIHVDFRLLVATNRNLKKEVEEGRFRSDLFYRLNVISIESPPLRSRKQDIPIIADFFIRQFCFDNNMNYRPLNKEELSKMLMYEWPGNVRELRNVIERLCILDSLPDEISSLKPDTTSNKDNNLTGRTLHDREKELVLQALEASRWNISKAADELGIGRKALYNRIAKYEITVPKRTK